MRVDSYNNIGDKRSDGDNNNGNIGVVMRNDVQYNDIMIENKSSNCGSNIVIVNNIYNNLGERMKRVMVIIVVVIQVARLVI